LLKVFEDRIPKLLYGAVCAVPVEWSKDDIYALYARLLWRLEFIRPLVAGDILRERRFPLKEGPGELTAYNRCVPERSHGIPEAFIKKALITCVAHSLSI
jgi:hypothetical protein